MAFASCFIQRLIYTKSDLLQTQAPMLRGTWRHTGRDDKIKYYLKFDCIAPDQQCSTAAAVIFLFLSVWSLNGLVLSCLARTALFLNSLPWYMELSAVCLIHQNFQLALQGTFPCDTLALQCEALRSLNHAMSAATQNKRMRGRITGNTDTWLNCGYFQKGTRMALFSCGIGVYIM